MPEAPREQALVEVVTILAELNVGPRFWATPEMPEAEQTYPNPVTIQRRFAVPAQIAEYPRLCILDASGSRREWGTGGISRVADHFTFVIYGYVIGNDRVSRSQWLERLRYDVFLTLMRAPMPRGKLRNFDFTLPEQTDQGAEEPVGVFVWPIVAVLDDAVAAA